MPAMPMTRRFGKEVARAATRTMASTGLVTMMSIAFGEPFAI